MLNLIIGAIIGATVATGIHTSLILGGRFGDGQ